MKNANEPFEQAVATHLEAIAESDVNSDKLVELMNNVYAEVDESLKVRV